MGLLPPFAIPEVATVSNDVGTFIRGSIGVPNRCIRADIGACARADEVPDIVATEGTGGRNLNISAEQVVAENDT